MLDCNLGKFGDVGEIVRDKLRLDLCHVLREAIASEQSWLPAVQRGLICSETGWGVASFSQARSIGTSVAESFCSM